jgi:predicted nucleotidyltransferase
MTKLRVGHVEFPMDAIREFCQRWQISELALFGSALRDDFRPDSDIDLLVTFAPDAHWSLFDLVDMRDELTGIFGRNVDFVSREAIEKSYNHIRRRNILNSAQVIYGS